MSIINLRGHMSAFPNYGAFRFQRIVFTLTNSVDFDEIWVFAVFMDFQYTYG